MSLQYNITNTNLIFHLTLKFRAVWPSETSVCYRNTTCRHNPQNLDLHTITSSSEKLFKT